MQLKCLILALLLTPLSLVAETPVEWTANDGQMILQGVPEIPADLVSRLKQYQDVRSASFLDWTRDGKGMYVRTSFGDIPQIHRVYAAGGTRQQLTWFTEPIGQVTRRSSGDDLAITMDRGGGEQDQIFLFSTKTARTRMISDGESRNRLVRWSNDGRLAAFQSTRRNGRNNDLWLMNPNRPGSEELLLEAPDGSWYGPVDFSDNDRFLLIQQFLSVDDSRILVLNLKSRELQLAAGDDQFPSANRALSFDRKGEGFYYITNVRGRAAELAWQPIDYRPDPDAEPEPNLIPGIAPGAKFLTLRIPWDVSDFAISDNGKRAAFVTNEEGISRLYLMDPQNQRYSLIKGIPVGQISGLGFNPDNQRLAFTLSTAQTPSDVYVVELGRRATSARALTRWTYSEVGGLDTSDFTRPELVHYPTFDEVKGKAREVPAFLYKPEGRGPFPVLIHLHGGPESQYRPAFSKRTQMWIAELGVAVVAPNIRGSSGYDSVYLALDNGRRREDAVKDIGALLDWIADQPQLDESRVAVYGASYGGYLVLASAVHYSDRLRAGVDVVGISNFVTFLENTEDYRRDFRRQEYGDERDPEMREFLQQISPLNNAARIDIPLLVVQGRNDPRVPASESEQIVKALRNRGHPVWYIEALNEGHGYERKENRNVYEQAVILFLRQFLLN